MTKPKLGPTGSFPRGKLSADDEGGLRIAISTVDSTIRIDFGKPVAWIGLDKPLAIAFAEAIIERARQP